MTNVVWGTAFFVSKAAAITYYRPYHYEDVVEAVNRKLAEGEIHIGPPPLEPGESLVIIDQGTRYAIREKPSTMPAGSLVLTMTAGSATTEPQQRWPRQRRGVAV